MDRDFSNIIRIMPGISTLNKTSASENVSEIYKQIRVIKERVISI